MNRFFHAACAGLLCWGVHADTAPAEPQWQSARSKQGVEVFTRVVPGSKFLAFKAVTVMQADIDVILTALADHKAYPQWYANCAGSEVIEWQENSGAVVHVTIKAPFPLTNRDVVNQVMLERGPDHAHISLVSLPRHVPEVEGVVRLTAASGSWRLEAQPGGNTLVTHMYHADPQARTPAWLVNRFVVDGPLKTLANLRQRVENYAFASRGGRANQKQIEPVSETSAMVVKASL